MSTFNLTNTATQVDTAIQAVVGADTAPTDASFNMVTSGGVKTYVDNAVGDLGSKTVTTESVGIASTDNDTSIPTSAAVKDYVDNAVSYDGTYGLYAYSTNGSYSITSSRTIPLEDYEQLQNNLGTVSGGVITLPAGAYMLVVNGSVTEGDSSFGEYFTIRLQHNNADKITWRTVSALNPTYDNVASTVSFRNATTFVSSSSSQTVRIYATETGSTKIKATLLSLGITKLA
jgi:hypothetical protein